MPYKIKVSGDAERDVRHLPGHLKQRARRLISALAGEPRPPGTKELRGYSGYFRIRIDGWRVIYRIYEPEQVILVLRIRKKIGPTTYSDLG